MLVSNMVTRVGARLAQTAGGIAVLAGLTVISAPGVAAMLVVGGAACAIAGAILEDRKDIEVGAFVPRDINQPASMPSSSTGPVSNVRLTSGNIGALRYARFPATVTPPVLTADIRTRLITCGLADQYGALVWQYDGPPGFLWIPRVAPRLGVNGTLEYLQDTVPPAPIGVLADGVDNTGKISASTTLVVM